MAIKALIREGIVHGRRQADVPAAEGGPRQFARQVRADVAFQEATTAPSAGFPSWPDQRPQAAPDPAVELPPGRYRLVDPKVGSPPIEGAFEVM
jgi:hypothetical protein